MFFSCSMRAPKPSSVTLKAQVLLQSPDSRARTVMTSNAEGCVIQPHDLAVLVHGNKFYQPSEARQCPTSPCKRKGAAALTAMKLTQKPAKCMILSQISRERTQPRYVHPTRTSTGCSCSSEQMHPSQKVLYQFTVRKKDWEICRTNLCTTPPAHPCLIASYRRAS